MQTHDHGHPSFDKCVCACACIFRLVWPLASASNSAPAPALSPFDDDPAVHNAGASENGNPFAEEDASELVVPRAGPAAVLGKGVGASSSSWPFSADNLDDLPPDEIDASELVFEEGISFGAFVEVYSGQWRGTDVAIKKLYANQFHSKEAVDGYGVLLTY
jgi:hypothetical protein